MCPGNGTIQCALEMGLANVPWEWDYPMYSRRHKKVPVLFPCNVRTLTVAFTLDKRSVPSYVLRTVGTVPSYASLRTVPFQPSVKAHVKTAREIQRSFVSRFLREKRELSYMYRVLRENFCELSIF